MPSEAESATAKLRRCSCGWPAPLACEYCGSPYAPTDSAEDALEEHPSVETFLRSVAEIAYCDNEYLTEKALRSILRHYRHRAAVILAEIRSRPDQQA